MSITLGQGFPPSPSPIPGKQQRRVVDGGALSLPAHMYPLGPSHVPLGVHIHMVDNPCPKIFHLRGTGNPYYSGVRHLLFQIFVNAEPTS